MNEWMKTQLASGLPAFTGSTISGTIAVKQELVNEVLAEMFSAARKDSPAPAAAVDLGVLTRFVKGASVRADAGTVSVDFTIAL